MDIFEMKRKAWHIAGGLLLIMLIYLEYATPTRLLLAIGLTILASLLSTRYRLPVIYTLMLQLERRENIKKFPAKGVVFFLIGCFLATVLFQKDIAIAGLIILTVGDSVSALFGIHYGTIKHPFSSKKFIEGHIAGALASFIVIMAAGALFRDINISAMEALLASAIAMFVEGIEIRASNDLTDDNIVLPLVAGAAIMALRAVL
jgi:dolichol kinase